MCPQYLLPLPSPHSCLNFFDTSPSSSLNFQAPFYLACFFTVLPNTSNVSRYFLLVINWSTYCFLNMSLTLFPPSWFNSNPSQVSPHLSITFLEDLIKCYLCQEALTNSFAHIHTCMEHPFPLLLWQVSPGLPFGFY